MVLSWKRCRLDRKNIPECFPNYIKSENLTYFKIFSELNEYKYKQEEPLVLSLCE